MTPAPHFAALRARLIRAPRAEPVALGGRHFIVTGATPGSLGYATALQLALWGARVAITTRRQPEQALEALRAALPPGRRDAVAAFGLDLCDADSVRRFAEAYHTHSGGRLDVLVNNAGIHLDLRSQWREPRLSADGHELHWRTNYLGTFQLTQALLPLLLDSAARTGDARVVNVVSQLHRQGRNAALLGAAAPYNSWHAYGNSKLALVHHARALEHRFGSRGLHAFSLHPGAVYTRIADKGLEGQRLIGLLRRWLAPVEAFFLLTPEEGAQTSLRCATAAGLTGGGYFQACAEAQASADAGDAQVAERLWQATASWVETLGHRRD